MDINAYNNTKFYTALQNADINKDGKLTYDELKTLFDTTDDPSISIIAKKEMAGEDQQKLDDYINGKVQLTQEENIRLDKNCDGILNDKDTLALSVEYDNLRKQVDIIVKNEQPEEVNILTTREQAYKDRQKIRKFMLNKVQLTDDEKKRLDKNGDGEVDVADFVITARKFSSYNKDSNIVIAKKKIEEEKQKIQDYIDGKIQLSNTEIIAIDKTDDGKLDNNDIEKLTADFTDFKKNISTLVQKEQAKINNQKIEDYLFKKTQLTTDEINQLDKNGDGKIDSADLKLQTTEFINLDYQSRLIMRDYNMKKKIGQI